MSDNEQGWVRNIIDKARNLVPQSRSTEPKHFADRLAMGQHKREFLIVGLGRFGTSLATTLNSYDHDVLALDIKMERVQSLVNTLPHVVQLDATNLDALKEVGTDAFETAIVCIGNNFEASLLATVNLLKLGVSRVISKANSNTQGEILRRVGASDIILPEYEAGVRLARRLAAVNFVDFMELTENTGVVEVVAPEELHNKTLLETNIRQEYGLTVVAIRRGEDVIVSPGAREEILPEDILVVLGRTEDCQRLGE